MKPGSVPTARIGPIIEQLIRERWPYGNGQEVLAEKVGCDESAIWNVVNQTSPGMGFDLADRLLCALGRWDMWHGELADIYPTKFIETCAIPSCGKKFPEKGGGTRIKRYCSPRCSSLGNGAARGEATGERLRQRGYCLKGHRMTPENTITKWRERDGRYEHQCRECKRTTQREWCRKQRAGGRGFREKQIRAQRKWRAKRAA